jgi:hypothetical protein
MLNQNLVNNNQPRRNNKKLMLTVAAIGLIGVVGIVAIFCGPLVTPETGLSVVNGHYEDPSGGC